MKVNGNPLGMFTSERWERTGVVTFADAERFMNYFKNVCDIHNKLVGIVPKDLISYYAKPQVYSGYSMGECIKTYYKGMLISEEDLRKQYSGKYKGSETHGLIVIDFPTKKKLREYLEKSKETALLMEKRRRGTISSEECDKHALLCREIRKILYDCVVKEESKIKKS